MGKSLSLVQKIRQRIQWPFFDFLFKVGLGSGLHKNRSGKRLLVYNGIDADGSTRFNSRFISAAYFEQQIAYFKSHFHVVDLATFFEEAPHPSKLTVAITFDDGYANNLHRALPILEKYQVPAAFFITGIRAISKNILWPDFLDLASRETDKELIIQKETFQKGRHGEYYSKTGKNLKVLCKEEDYGFIDAMLHAFPPNLRFKEDESLSDYWQQLTVEEIRELTASPLVTIGSHGYLHTSLGNILLENAVEEMSRSKQFLEKTTGKAVTSIAYPDGSYSSELVQQARQLGFKHQLLVDYNDSVEAKETDLAPRFSIDPYISWNNQLLCLLRGSY